MKKRVCNFSVGRGILKGDLVVEDGVGHFPKVSQSLLKCCADSEEEEKIIEVFPWHVGGKWGAGGWGGYLSDIPIHDNIYECRSCEIGLNRANSQAGPIRMFSMKLAP